MIRQSQHGFEKKHFPDTKIHTEYIKLILIHVQGYKTNNQSNSVFHWDFTKAEKDSTCDRMALPPQQQHYTKKLKT